MFALTTEAIVVIVLGAVIALVCLGLYAIRGHTEAAAEGKAGLVKLSAPASLVGIVIGAVLVLVGAGFFSLGSDFGDDDDEPNGVAVPPIVTVPLYPTTTIESPPSTAPSTTQAAVLDDSIAPPTTVLAATGSAVTVQAGLAVILLSLGLHLVVVSRSRLASVGGLL